MAMTEATRDPTLWHFWSELCQHITDGGRFDDETLKRLADPGESLYPFAVSGYVGPEWMHRAALLVPPPQDVRLRVLDAIANAIIEHDLLRAAALIDMMSVRRYFCDPDQPWQYAGGGLDASVNVVIPFCGVPDVFSRAYRALTSSAFRRPGPMLTCVFAERDRERVEAVVDRRHVFQSVRLINTGDHQLGFAANCNRGASVSLSSSDHVTVFLNTDAIVDPMAIEEMAETIRTSDSISACGPLGDAVSGFQSVGRLPDEDLLVSGMFRRSPIVSRRAPVPRLVGYCLAVRTTDFYRVGGFHCGYGRGNFEDDDLCLRLAALRGRYSLWQARALVRHVGGVSFQALGASALSDAMQFASKVHGERWGPVPEVLYRSWQRNRETP